MYKVLFVCTGNICRSPTAEGVFRAMIGTQGLDRLIGHDSSGMGGWHVGNPPDRRATAAARGRGYDISDLRARQTTPEDFDAFDLILAMDRGHFRELKAIAPPGGEDKVRMFMAFAEGYDPVDVPDPYYGGADGFETVLDMIEAGSRGLIDHLRREHLKETG